MAAIRLLNNLASTKFLSNVAIKNKVVWLLLFVLVSSISTLKAQVTGTIFRDFNGNGTQQTTAPAIEPGIANVTVNAYNSSDVLLATTTTSATGTYTLGVGTSSVRIEYVLPSNCFVNPTIDYSGLMGVTFGSNVQFKTGGAGITANFAVTNPADYVNTTNPNFIINTYRNGNPLVIGTAATGPAMYSAAYNNSGTTPVPTTISTTAEIGSTWGIAYSKPSKKAFTSAFVKRHAGLGAGGNDPKLPVPINAPGSIYIVDPTGKTGTFFFSLDALGASYYTHSHTAGNALYVRSNSERNLPGGIATANRDSTTYDQIGKVGIGGLDISDDGRYLFLVNLYDKKLYKIDLQDAANPIAPTAAQITSYAIPNPNPAGALNGGEFRPFAVKFSRGKVYVGGVTSGQNSTPASAASNASMNAYVYSFDVTTSVFNTTALLTFPLNHARGTNSDGILENWRPWNNTFAPSSVGSGSNYRGGQPQPMFTDIEIDATNSVIIGFRDRFGDQSGYQNSIPTANTLFSGFSYGDTYRGKIDCSGTWSFENNGTVNGITIASGAGNGQGPGGGEYYYQDNINTYQINNGLGGLAQLMGDVDVMTSIPDPINIWSQGVSKMRYTDGTNSNDYQMELTAQSTGLLDGTFGKANGMGDVELMLDAPPIEIGNRVWNDANGDGIQEAGEAGISGVAVLLYSNGTNGIAGDGDDVQVGSVTTNASGDYYFTTATGTDITGIDYGVTINTNSGYNLRIASSQWTSGSLKGTGVLANYGVTITDKVGAGQADLSDNDASLSGVPMISFITGTYGQNNHNLDFGFVPAVLTLGNYVWNDQNNDGLQTSGEPVIAGATVKLYKADGTTVVATTTTDPNGLYTFTALAPASYIVGVTIPAGYTAAITTATSANPDNDNLTDNNGVTTVSGELKSNAITLTLGGEPTTDGDGVNGNLTLDFGLKGTGSIGDFVWNDTNADGLQTGGESGINNATVTLTYPNGATLATTTNVSGAYLFSNLAPGTYSVTFTTPTGYTPTLANVPGDDTKDSDPVSGVVSGITLTVGQNNLTIDAGFRACPGAPTSAGASVCYKTPVTLTATGVPNASFAWYTASTGGTLLASTASYLTDSLTKDTVFYVQQTIGGQCGPSVRTAVAVTVKALPISGITGPATICAKEAALFIALGAGTDATYAWTFEDATPPTAVGTSATPMWDTAGEYAITLTVMKNGCPVVYDTTIVITQPVFADGGPDDELCLGGNTVLTGKGPAGANFLWQVISGDPGSIDIGGTTQSITISPTETTVFRLTVSQNGCVRTDEVIVYVNVSKNPTAYAGGNKITCSGVGVIIGGDQTTPTGTPPPSMPGAPLGYSWSGPGLNDPTIANPTVTITAAGTYDYRVIVYNKLTGCSDTAFTQVTVQQCYTLGNTVWYDKNDNGNQDPGEPGINGISVKLYDCNGIYTGRTVATDAFGIYHFTNVPSGNYIVGIVTPDGYTKSSVGTTTILADNQNDGVIIAGTEIRTNCFPLNSSSDNIDFGLKGLGSIGDLVWNDFNGNGIQDDGEPGIGGQLVTLTYPGGATIATLTDTKTGTYLFSNLAPGAYSVSFVTPAGFVTTLTNQGVNDSLDSDPINNIVTPIILGAAENNLTVDAGFYLPLGSIGDKVWNDLNRNGIQEPGELGVAGITVTLYNNVGVTLSTTITDAYGNYKFNNLPVGLSGANYQVRFSLPAEYQFTLKDVTTDDKDSDPDLTTGKTGIVPLTPANKDRTDVDAGIYYSIPARIGDFIWNDANINGVQDPGEAGIAGVTLTLYNSLGAIERSTVTDNNGFYRFTDVPTGVYTIGVTPPIAFTLTIKDQGDDAKDSDFDSLTFRTDAFVVVPGTVNLTFDGGFYAVPKLYASVGDYVWNDINNNGLQDAGEPGVQGVTVELYTASNILVNSMLTDVFGNYVFNNLIPDAYYVKFSGIPIGYVVVAPNVGGVANVAIDNDINNANGLGTTPTFILVAGQNKMTVDAGIHNTSVTNNSSIGDYVFYDLNKNGLQDVLTDVGVPGVTVTLYDGVTGATIKSTTSNTNGKYLFTDLAIGSYVVGFTNIPAGYILTAKDGGADDVDSDGDPATGRTGVYDIFVDGTSILTVDQGIISDPNVRDSKGSIGDKVWEDINFNAVQDAGEPGVADVTVTLYAGDGVTVLGTTTTDGLGNYIFTNLDAGNYVVGFSSLPVNYEFTLDKIGTITSIDSDPNPATGLTSFITLAAGEVNMTIDAGIYSFIPKSTIGDRVWFDNNGNGIQDPNESGVPGVSVTLANAGTGEVKTTVTGANGIYLFTALDAGNYVLYFNNLPVGYVPTTQNAAGSTTTNDSDPAATGLTSTIVLPATTTDLSWDLGIVSSSRASLGDYVWSDTDVDGIQDPTELGVAGITVTLYNNSTGAALANTITDGTGYYNFSNLTPGNYNVGFSNIPVNSGFTIRNAAGSTAVNNSDVNPATGITVDVITLLGGQIRTDIDAGIISTFAAVGDYVWYDINENGRQDANEPPVSGVLVTLYSGNTNTKVASAVTDGNGKYFINNIPVNGITSFTIMFTNTPLNTQGFTVKNSPAANAKTNSDANPATGRTDVFTLSPSQIRLDIDAGIITTSGGPLPVTFTSLQGSLVNGVSNLKWSTVSEYNASYFQLEYSVDGVTFTGITNVAAAGNSNTRRDYGYGHTQPKVGANYYRLKVVDKDGRFTYSNIVVLNDNVTGINITGVYPNPFIDRVNISVVTERNDVVNVRLFNDLGQLVRHTKSNIQAGSNILTINNLSMLPKGTYMIDVRTTDKVLTRKLIK